MDRALGMDVGASRWPIAAAVALIAALAVARLLTYGFRPDAQLIDFSHYWLAGHMWADGENPYTALFRERALQLFGDGDPQPPLFWAYAPNWFGPAVLLGLMPVRLAGLAFAILNALVLAGGFALLMRTGRQLGQRIGGSHLLLLVAFACSMTATTACFGTGNCALLLFGGTCLIAWGLAAGSPRALTAGLVILLLKPNFGIPLVIAVAALPGGWRPALYSVAVSAVLALPSLLVAAPFAMLEGLAANLRTYETFLVNSPAQQTGVVTLSWTMGGPVVPALWLALPATLSAVLLPRLALRRIAPDDRWRRVQAIMFALLGSAIFLNRLHIYDLVLLIPLLFLATGARPMVIACVVAGATLVFRPENVSTLLGLAIAEPPLAAAIASLGCLFFYLAALLLCAAPSGGPGKAR